MAQPRILLRSTIISNVAEPKELQACLFRFEVLYLRLGVEVVVPLLSVWSGDLRKSGPVSIIENIRRNPHLKKCLL
jgi:hypothetical protein